MGIRFNCPNGHKLNVKEFLAGKRGVCPQCGAKFVIPMPTDTPLSEVPQPVGVGQSQSVEIETSPAPSYPAASAVPSPSVIIPVTEMELAPPEIRGSEIPITDVLPASIVAVPPLVPATTGITSDAAIPSQRDRSRRNQIVISLLLLALVVLLAGVLIWVLMRNGNPTPAEKTTTANRGEFNPVFAMASGGLLMSAESHVGALDQ